MDKKAFTGIEMVLTILLGLAVILVIYFILMRNYHSGDGAVSMISKLLGG